MIDKNDKKTKREKLRDRGQFWTPDWIADAMVVYVSQGAEIVFDPGVGKGAFYTALKKLNPKIRFYGTDIDAEVIEESKREGIFDNVCNLEVRDFILNPPRKLFKAIIANPPYIRHHRLSSELKNHFRTLSLRLLGVALDGRAGLHIYFLIQALSLLDKGGRLAFIMPADTCEGVFAKKLWDWISKAFCIEGVITFEHSATPFPGVDTNPMIFLISNNTPKLKLKWIKCLTPQNIELCNLLENDLAGDNFPNLIIYERDLTEALKVGLSRAPRKNHDFEFTLTDFAYVMRGIATGANEFFFLTRKRADELGIPDEFLLSAVGRTRDTEGSYLTKETITELEKKGRPTLLFFPNGSLWENMPSTVKNYINEGEKLGFHKRTLISTRHPWYRMEVRKIPLFLFAYLGRRNARFIRNSAGIVPLTGFLCVYPRSTDSEYINKLWIILQHPDTISNLQLVGKSYGSDAIKVEPRALENLPISEKLVSEIGLEPINVTTKSLPLFNLDEQKFSFLK